MSRPSLSWLLDEGEPASTSVTVVVKVDVPPPRPEPPRPEPKPKRPKAKLDDEQHEHMDRIMRSPVAAAVLRFATANLDREFRAAELLGYVARTVAQKFAPDSVSRAMRQLRKEGALDYEVIDKGKSLYQITRVQ